MDSLNGIDAYAHIGALSGISKKAIAVLGNGLNKEVLYPKENIMLCENILKSNGCIVSEYPINQRAEQYFFPERNRIVSGISDKVLVVEANLKSGTFITVDYALEQGKDVYAVPGNIHSPQSLGCNRLIQEGAGLYIGFEDLIV